MKFGSIAAAALSVLSWTAGAASYNAEKLASMVGKDGIIRLTDRTFDSVVEGPRDYTLAVLLTAEGPQYSCGFCKIVSPSWKKIASSWHQDHADGDGLFFATADVADCPSTFRKLGLNQAPNLWIYSEAEKAQASDLGYEVYRFPAVQEHASLLAEYLSNVYGKNVVIHEPFPYDKVFMTVATVVALVAGLYIYRGVVFSALQYKPVWAALSLLLILMFIAGYMFNAIRQPPYVAGDGNGGVMYFIAGHGTQLVIETQIMAIVYAAMTFAGICLVIKVPRIKDPRSVIGLVGILSLILFFGYSFVLSKFRIKNGGFPYSLLDIF